jgi:hypothetical protein
VPKCKKGKGTKILIKTSIPVLPAIRFIAEKKCSRFWAEFFKQN